MSRVRRDGYQRTVALVLAVALGSSGCSFGMATAPSHPRARTPEAARACTASPLLPVLDTLSAGVGAYNTAVSTAADDEVQIYGISTDKGVGLTLGITQLALFGAGAIYGYVQLGRCHALRKEERLGDEEAELTPLRGPRNPARPNDETASEAAPSTPARSELPTWSAFRRVPLAASSAQPSSPRAGNRGP